MNIHAWVKRDLLGSWCRCSLSVELSLWKNEQFLVSRLSTHTLCLPAPSVGAILPALGGTLHFCFQCLLPFPISHSHIGLILLGKILQALIDTRISWHKSDRFCLNRHQIFLIKFLSQVVHNFGKTPRWATLPTYSSIPKHISVKVSGADFLAQCFHPMANHRIEMMSGPFRRALFVWGVR